MKKLISLIMIFTLLFSSLGITVFSASESTENQISDLIIPEEEKILCDATIEDDFEDDSVIVVFKNTKSKKLENHTIDAFSEVSAKSVKDLTSRTKNKIERQRNKGKQTKALNDNTTAATSDEMNVNENKFHQIVKIDLDIKSKENVLECIKKLEKRDDVLMAFPNYYFKPTSVTPNDLYYQSYGEWATDKIALPQAWDIAGDNTVKVGVLDSGIDKTHPDLTYKYNATLSKDFTGGNSPGTDSRGHGTQVAGIIGAQANNGIGVAGVCWTVSLVSLKVGAYNDEGEFVANLGLVAEAIDHATDNNIPILNFSYCGENTYSSKLATALGNYPGLFVCTTSNERVDVSDDDYAYYDYNPNQTIVVAGTNIDDELYTYYDENNDLKGSSYSATKVHLAAPGYDIWTTTTGGGYIKTYGTSMAAPYVAGVAALLKSKYPNMDARALRDNIINNVDVIPALEGKVSTGGRLNAYKALSNPESFTIRYDPGDGGGTAMKNSNIIRGCSTALSANTYSNADCEFKGWFAQRQSSYMWYYRNASGTDKGWYLEGQQPPGYYKYLYKDKQKVSRTAAADDTVIMYAVWNKTLNYQFDGNDADSGTIDTVTLNSGTTGYLSSVFERNGFSIDHWYARNSDGEHYYTNGTNRGWYAVGSKPSGYTRVDFAKGGTFTNDDFNGTDNGDTIYMCVYWKPNSGVLGDANGSGTVTTTDATLIQKYLLNQATIGDNQLLLADVNFDGKVTVSDATLIQKYVAKTIDEFGT